MKHIRLGLWICVAIAFVLFIVLNLPQKNDDHPAIQPVAGFNKGSHFVLTDHLGGVFDSSKKLNEGDYALIFFGFTHCPSICPTELQKIGSILDSLPQNIREKIKPLFITIDPERDTVSLLKDYISLFHPDIIGLTGHISQIHPVLDQWKVFYNKVNDPQFTEYTMDHSTYIYLTNHTMDILGLFRMQHSIDQITHYVEATIK